MNRYAIVMAGGAGLRLWPLSRQSKPKQFISVDGGECMLVQTIRRICGVIAPDHCYVITNENLLELTRGTLEGLIPLSNILTETLRKNTAACIAYAAMVIREKHGPGVLCFIPADGSVKDSQHYQQAILQAFNTAEHTGELVVIGIVPAYPATGYGYIHVNKDPEILVSNVYGFIEKPDAEMARNMIKSGEYLWNSGIVVGLADVIIKCVGMYLPYHYSGLAAVVRYMDQPDYPERLREAYSRLDAISFDYGVLEKAQGIYAIKAYFDWDDIGSLDALYKTLEMDKYGNATWGPNFNLDTHNSVIYSDGMLIATIGIDDMIVAASKDAMVICPRERAQEIKSFVEKLEHSELNRFI